MTDTQPLASFPRRRESRYYPGFMSNYGRELLPVDITENMGDFIVRLST